MALWMQAGHWQHVWVSRQGTTQMGGHNFVVAHCGAQHSTRAQALEARMQEGPGPRGGSRGRYPLPWLSDVSMPLSETRRAGQRTNRCAPTSSAVMCA